jgi:hypothetical protein
MSEEALDSLVSFFDGFRGQPTVEALNEIKKLREIREWAIGQLRLGYEPGDRVQILTPPEISPSSGWNGYQEALAAGRTGTAGDLHFLRGQWYCDLHMDRAWSVSRRPRDGHPDEIYRYWKGPVAETPDGMVPPSEFDIGRHPEGLVKVFMFRAAHLGKADLVPEYDATGLPRAERGV